MTRAASVDVEDAPGPMDLCNARESEAHGRWLLVAMSLFSYVLRLCCVGAFVEWHVTKPRKAGTGAARAVLVLLQTDLADLP